MGFSDATSLVSVGDGRFDWDVPDGWQQGRGAWGGLVAGAVTRAVQQCEPDPNRTVRTLSLHLAAPLTVGRAAVWVEPRRVGSGMSTWGVTVGDSTGGPCAHAVLITGLPRAPELDVAEAGWGTALAPELPAWQRIPETPTHGPGWPRFMRHLEFRVISGPPLSGGAAESSGYVRFAGQAEWDAGQLLSVVDAWYPSALTVLDAVRPLATVTFAAHLLVSPSTVPAGEPLGFTSSMSAAHEGFTTESRRIWAPDGRLVVENHQAIVVIR